MKIYQAFPKSFIVLALLATVGVGVLFAQGAPRRFMQQIEVHRGNLVLGTSVDVVLEGATVNAFDTTLTVEDPTSDTTWTIPNDTDTAVGLATTVSLTNKTLGKGTVPRSFRQEFDAPCIKRELADFTAELVTDAAVNIAMCDGSLGLSLFSYRLDGAQATPFLSRGGKLDIDNDAANNEGVEIVFAEASASTQGWAIRGVSPAMYVRASITIGSVSGTDNMAFGWKRANAHIDDYVVESINTGGFFHINDNAGNIEIQTASDGTDADDEADANPVWSNNETIVLEVRVSTSGVFTFYQDGTAVTVTTATGAAAANDIMVPFISLIQASDANTELEINWIEIGEVI